MKRPRLPRFISGGPRQSGFSRADLGTTPCAGNAHPKKPGWPIQTPSKTVLDGLGWALGAHRHSPTTAPSKPIQAHPSPSPIQPRLGWAFLAALGDPRFPIQTCFGWACGSHPKQRLAYRTCRRTVTFEFERGRTATSPFDWFSMVLRPF